jgi:hypothetical protein
MTSIPLTDPLTRQPLAVHNARIPAPEPFSLKSLWGERYTVGVDLGQSQDFTAICVVRRLEEEGAKPIFQVGFLQRLPLGTTYPAIVAYVINRMSNPRLRGADLVIDFTGVGRPVFDLFRVKGVSPIGVAITAGHAITRDGSIWSVPKGHLISRVQALLHEKRLKIHSDLPDAAALVQELQDFRVNFTESGYAQFNARTGKHDDLVLALAIALWHSHGDHSSFDNWMTFMRGQQPGSAAASPQQPELVKMKRPDHSAATTLYTMTGEKLDIGPDGVVEVAGDQVTAMLQAGWNRVEAAAEILPR